MFDRIDENHTSQLSGGITIPSGVTSIGDGAFALTNLEKITIPKSVKTIGDGSTEFSRTFSYCANLKSVYILGNTTTWSRYTNPFADDVYTPKSKINIYAEKGSKAETLAKAYKMKFVVKTSAELKALSKIKPAPAK